MIESKSFSRRAFLVINAAIMVILAFSCAYPIWYTLCLSISDKAATNAGWVTFYPIGFTTAAYKEIMRDPTFFNSFWISVQRVFIGTPMTLLVCIMMAYPLSKTFFGPKAASIDCARANRSCAPCVMRGANAAN